MMSKCNPHRTTKPLQTALHRGLAILSVMQTSELLAVTFNWVLGLLGMLALIVVLAFLPDLFGFADPAYAFMSLGGMVLSKGIVHFFDFQFGIGVLVVSTALFVWVALLFSMSSHSLVEAVFSVLGDDMHDGVVPAWLSVLVVNFLLVSLFVYILFGMILQPAMLLICGLMLLAMAALLAANYKETYHI